MNDFEFDIDDYFVQMAEKITIRSVVLDNKLKIKKGDIHSFSSTFINFAQDPVDIREEFITAIRSMELSVAAINDLGLRIEILKIKWWNIRDSCHNLMGHTGYYILDYRIV